MLTGETLRLKIPIQPVSGDVERGVFQISILPMRLIKVPQIAF